MYSSIYFSFKNYTFRYGSPSIMYRLANYTVEAMLYLSINEFSTPEREQRLGVMVCS